MGVFFPVFLTLDAKYEKPENLPPTPTGRPSPCPTGPLPPAPDPGVSQPCIQTPALPVTSFTT